jgi:hypothetical protein
MDAQDTKRSWNLKGAKRQKLAPIEILILGRTTMPQAPPTAQPETERQKLAAAEMRKFILTCATIFEDARAPAPRHHTPHEPSGLTDARRGLHLLVSQCKRRANTDKDQPPGTSVDKATIIRADRTDQQGIDQLLRRMSIDKNTGQRETGQQDSDQQVNSQAQVTTM